MNKFAKMISIVILTLAVFPGCGDDSGNGKSPASAADVEIRTAAELDNVRNNLSGSYKLMADISLSSYADWEPIGSDGNPFTGKIDGNGYEITGLKIDRITAVHAGLFGYVRGGEIIDLALKDVDIAGGGDAGAIAGSIEDSTIINCHSTGRIASGDASGGIAGSVYNSRIINSSSAAYVVSYLDDSTGSMSGGIAGYAQGSEIAGCFSSGNVFSSSHNSASGGIAGGAAYDSLITNSYSTGDIESYSDSDEPGDSVSGGIAGYVWNGTITNSYSTGNITSSSYSGGIAGSSEGDDKITGCAAINGAINADHDAGRIAGYVYFPESSEISNNFALEDMIADGMAGFDAADARRHGGDKSDFELKQQSTYSGELNWKFGGGDAAPWQMPFDGYPILYWE